MAAPPRVRLGALLLATVTTLLVACGSSDGGSTGEGDVVRAKRPDAAVTELVSRAECAEGNGVHAVGTYDVAKFDPAAVMTAFRARDREKDCAGRVYSTSRESGAAQFAEFLSEQAELFDDSCYDDKNPAELREKLRAFTADPANKAVFTSVHDNEKDDDPVHCAYVRAEVYRADGTVAKFDFDWSD